MRQRYKPIREMSDHHASGMNQPKRGKRFGTIADAMESNAAYWGERAEWYIVAGQHRDSLNGLS